MTLEHTPVERTIPTPGVVLALLVLGLVAAAVAVPDVISGSPNDVDPTDAFHSPSFQHFFGTDWLGRDVFARVVHGARASLAIGIGGTALASFAGSVWVSRRDWEDGRSTRSLCGRPTYCCPFRRY